ncbi:hypothetical protein J31TS6_57310 [Brevibacillus reuszeri]|uniref:helix-turn-helix transcriptional regulator n=1 Tax=Brevibacillus reuszeri TaxID=54915 RepID=UPI001B160B9B|nr:helix-turn-helix transcriptional regulator [Brevibacillus reuszeri]GIO09703.1 hypothetical protein J31TS6_57310 [Brevibacillus reuszeri]
MGATAKKVPVPRLNMKELRLAKKLSQHALAVKIGCTANHIRFLERGYVDPSVQIANSISNELGEDVYTVFPDIFSRSQHA